MFKIEYFGKSNLVTTSYVNPDGTEPRIDRYNVRGMNEALVTAEKFIIECIDRNALLFGINFDGFKEEFMQEEQTPDDYFEWAGEFYLSGDKLS